jgi:hydrogenase maturation protein HypF
MGDPVTLDALAAGAQRLSGLLDVEPRALACDMHPGYSSARWARRAAAGRPLHLVQHHHAHAAALLAEHGRDPAEEVIAVALDGSGYGPDETVWGGEILVASCRAARRIAHLSPVPLPGGELAVRSPARMALAHLWAAGLPWDEDLPPVAALGGRERAIVLHQLEKGLNAPLTTSAGRLFDAVAALSGVCGQIRFEGEAAMLLEGLASEDAQAAPYPLELDGDAEIAISACAPVIAGVVGDVRAGAPPQAIAARLHATLTQFALDAARLVRERHGLTTVALSGGVFQNVLLLRMTMRALREDGFDVLAHRLVPPNDGGLALGQVAVAAACEAER